MAHETSRLKFSLLSSLRAFWLQRWGVEETHVARYCFTGRREIDHASFDVLRIVLCPWPMMSHRLW